jgi:hypothetical protein
VTFPSRATILWGVSAVFAVVLAVVVGRAEGVWQGRVQNDAFGRLLAAVGGEHPRAPVAYRLTPGFSCLLWPVGRDPYAIELCFDPKGRVVEAIDRRRALRRYWTLRFDPGRSDVRLGVGDLVLLFRSLGATGARGAIPLGLDVGPNGRPFHRGCDLDSNSNDWEVVLAPPVVDEVNAAAIDFRAAQLVPAPWYGSKPLASGGRVAVARFCSRRKAVAFVRALVRAGFPSLYGYPSPRLERHGVAR